MDEARKQQSIIVGIDLGTTMSAVAVIRDSKPLHIKNELGDVLTPSVVAYDDTTGGMVVGRLAKDILAMKPRQAVALFKRDMGADTLYNLADNELTPIQLSAYLLEQLKADAERELGESIDRCVITVPAYFNEPQRHATKLAGELAGFTVERILNEPTAAAIAYGMHDESEKTFVVLDLGGGTFDVCVMELFDGLLEVRSVAGESQLGGEDFTLAIAEFALGKTGGAFDSLDLKQRTRLIKRAELLKRQLSRWPQADIRVPGPDDSEQPVTLSSEEVQQCFEPLLQRIFAPCRSALRGAGIGPEDVDEILLVGGATRMPCIHRMVRELFGREAVFQSEPDLVVVHGAAVQAAFCANDSCVDDMVVTDVASHSLGIEVTREIGGRWVNGFFSPMVQRNTVIPVSQSELFQTLSANQKEIKINVFEGENRKCDANRLLGSFRVSGIPKREPRDAIKVRFTYDLNGILEVEAQVIETGETFSRLFDRQGVQLSGDAMDAAREQLRRLKADPLERPKYRDIVNRANLLWSELGHTDNDALSLAMDEFEAALATHTPQVIEACYQKLLEVCKHYDRGERW